MQMPGRRIPAVVVSQSEYLERLGTPKHPSELLSHDCIAWSRPSVDTFGSKNGGAEKTFRFAPGCQHKRRFGRLLRPYRIGGPDRPAIRRSRSAMVGSCRVAEFECAQRVSPCTPIACTVETSRIHRLCVTALSKGAFISRRCRRRASNARWSLSSSCFE